MIKKILFIFLASLLFLIPLSILSAYLLTLLLPPRPATELGGIIYFVLGMALGFIGSISLSVPIVLVFYSSSPDRNKHFMQRLFIAILTFLALIFFTSYFPPLASLLITLGGLIMGTFSYLIGLR